MVEEIGKEMQERKSASGYQPVGCNIIQLECQITPYYDVSDRSEVLVAQKTCDVIMLTEEVVCGKSFCSQFFFFFFITFSKPLMLQMKGIQNMPRKVTIRLLPGSDGGRIPL